MASNIETKLISDSTATQQLSDTDSMFVDRGGDIQKILLPLFKTILFNDEGSKGSITRNSNGTAVKFPNGLMVSWKQMQFTVEFKEEWGSLWSSPSVDLGDFPVAYAEVPVVAIISYSGGSGVLSAINQYILNTTKTSFGTTYFARPYETGYGLVIPNILAIGLWKTSTDVKTADYTVEERLQALEKMAVNNI